MKPTTLGWCMPSDGNHDKCLKTITEHYCNCDCHDQEKKRKMNQTLKQLQTKLDNLLLEQLQAYQDYTLKQTAENYDRILKLKKQVNRAKQELARNS